MGGEGNNARSDLHRRVERHLMHPRKRLWLSTGTYTACMTDAKPETAGTPDSAPF